MFVLKYLQLHFCTRVNMTNSFKCNQIGDASQFF